MLEFLVTTKARRRMLQLLWGRGDCGSVSQLAERADVGFANAYRELRAMAALDLVTTTREDAAEVYRANREHPLASALGALVSSNARQTDTQEVRTVRGQLRTLGAPLHQTPVPVPDESLEQTIVRGVRLARRDATVARALPLCIYRQRDRLSVERLRRWALEYGEKAALGFFLDLTADLAKDRRLRQWAAPLRDRRRTLRRDFFVTAPHSPEAEQQAEDKTPPAARRWGFRMNMDLDAFRSTFDRFAHAA